MEMRYGGRSNVILGMIGALLGDALGISAYIYMYRQNIWGYVAAMLLCLLIFIGYRLLGGTIDINGLILCSLIYIVSLYPTELAAVTYDLMDAMKEQGLLSEDASFWGMYKMTPSLISVAGAEYKTTYWLEVIVGYAMLIAMLIVSINRGALDRKWQNHYVGRNLIGRDYVAGDQNFENYTSENHGGNYPNGNPSDGNPSDENYLL